MKIAFLIDEKLQMEAEKTKEWKSLNLIFRQMGYDLIVLYLPFHKKLSDPENLKYAAFFNGKPFVFNMGEILYLESYYRKTSVMIKDGRMRIKARLNEEEQRLPKEWFIRISRHNIVNMHNVRSVKGDEVEMVNGDVLYISYNRRKEFGKGYRDFLRLNNILV
ncbi:LytTR family transcriptional regulator DNA-binding domain-containing protein [Lacrimispora sp. 38-1]|uniref:LytTR family transcriptional regulator DNA-binding domain-containing protein n=1 Tax=Lacrimispora sp. 38-1 TaxID=3125778 RepID=UPI003CF9EF12